MTDLIPQLLTLIGLMVAFSGFYEWRIRVMYSQMREKMDDNDRIHQIVQSGLKEDIARLEAKIDMMLNLQLGSRLNGSSKDNQ